MERETKPGGVSSHCGENNGTTKKERHNKLLRNKKKDEDFSSPRNNEKMNNYDPGRHHTDGGYNDPAMV
jgi:hypothetical protein